MITKCQKTNKITVVLHESGMRMLGQFLPVSDVCQKQSQQKPNNSIQLPEFVSAINLLSFEPNVCRGSSLLVMAAKHAHTRNVVCPYLCTLHPYPYP